MIEKDYLKFEELKQRWGCEAEDIHYLIANQDLRPSIVWRWPVIECHWVPSSDPDDAGKCFLRPIEGQFLEEEGICISGWVYLRLPMVHGPDADYGFEYATLDFDQKSDAFCGGWYRLQVQRLKEYLGYFLEQDGVFMKQAIDHCETICRPDLRDAAHRIEAVAPPFIENAPAKANSHHHISDKLTLLNQAAIRFWLNASHTERDTHHTNAEVAAWLVKQGLSSTLADKAATIIRPEWVPVGRKGKE